MLLHICGETNILIFKKKNLKKCLDLGEKSAKILQEDNTEKVTVPKSKIEDKEIHQQNDISDTLKRKSIRPVKYG